MVVATNKSRARHDSNAVVERAAFLATLRLMLINGSPDQIPFRSPDLLSAIFHAKKVSYDERNSHLVAGRLDDLADFYGEDRTLWPPWIAFRYSTNADMTPATAPDSSAVIGIQFARSALKLGEIFRAFGTIALSDRYAKARNFAYPIPIEPPTDKFGNLSGLYKFVGTSGCSTMTFDTEADGSINLLNLNLYFSSAGCLGSP